ncbi:recombinase family protein (plasmid) [Curtobacterium flaccumfaciens pv. flaccumfaciens]|uniref:recombinase family protein n=1 Tax=Curtobacterium flaccumfaciens TaxID=2035 RepID=UPI003A4E5513
MCDGLGVVQHKTQIVAYVRVSSIDQNLDRQLETIGEVDRVFEEKISGGARTDRLALADCIGYVRDGDVVRVASMDRLARSLGDLRDIVDEITTKGASVEFEGTADLQPGHRRRHRPAHAQPPRRVRRVRTHTHPRTATRGHPYR